MGPVRLLLHQAHVSAYSMAILGRLTACTSFPMRSASDGCNLMCGSRALVHCTAPCGKNFSMAWTTSSPATMLVSLPTVDMAISKTRVSLVTMGQLRKEIRSIRSTWRCSCNTKQLTKRERQFSTRAGTQHAGFLLLGFALLHTVRGK